MGAGIVIGKKVHPNLPTPVSLGCRVNDGTEIFNHVNHE